MWTGSSPAWADDDFRERLKADPHAAIAEETGVEVPEATEIVVLEETAEQGYLVIPRNRVALTEEQLEAASGGGDPHCSCAEIREILPERCHGSERCHG